VSGAAMAAQTLTPQMFAATIERKLKAAQYMVQNCSNKVVAGWEGFETRLCTYRVKDSATGTVKEASVVLLNPTAQKLATWIVTACSNVLPDTDLSACAGRIFNRVLEQSGGQFPVAGVVYEDLLPQDGHFEAYAFRDGVTTIVEGV